jgi:hypothetical protein
VWPCLTSVLSDGVLQVCFSGESFCRIEVVGTMAKRRTKRSLSATTCAESASNTHRGEPAHPAPEACRRREKCVTDSPRRQSGPQSSWLPAFGAFRRRSLLPLHSARLPRRFPPVRIFPHPPCRLLPSLLLANCGSRCTAIVCELTRQYCQRRAPTGGAAG